MTKVVAPRKRSLEVAGRADVVTPELQELAKELYFKHQTALALDGEAGVARKSLFAKMKEMAINAFNFTATEGRKSVELQVEIGAGRNSSSVDMVKLQKLVNDDAKLLAALVADGMSSARVNYHFGGAISDQVTTTVPGREDVRVGPKK